MNWLPLPDGIREVTAGALVLLLLLVGEMVWLGIKQRQRFKAAQHRIIGILRVSDLLSSPSLQQNLEKFRDLLAILGILDGNLVEMRPALNLSIFDERCGGRWLFGDVRIVAALLSDIIHNFDRENDWWASEAVAKWLVHSERFRHHRPDAVLAQMIHRHPEIKDRLRIQISIAQSPTTSTNWNGKSWSKKTAVTK